MAIAAPDLTQRPPRSPRVRLGGYVILPRMLDKGRAEIIGKSGEYHFNCPMDQQFVTFVGIEPTQLRGQLSQGKGDGEILDWIDAHAKLKRSPWDIATWSSWQCQRAPADMETRGFFNDYHSKAGPNRKDVATWFDVLDIDDHVTFGGKA